MSEHRAQEYPLAQASTPRFLQKFTYNHEGDEYVFDESLLAPKILQQQARRLLRLGIPSFRPPSRPAAASAAPAHQPAAIEESALTPLGKRTRDCMALNPLQPPSKRHADDTRVEGDPGSDAQSPHDDGFNLLSPTASPREEPEVVLPANGPESPCDLSVETNAPTDILCSEHQELEELASPFSNNTTLAVPPLSASDRSELAALGNLDTLAADVASSIPSIVETFEQLPQGTHRYVLYSLFRSCNRQTLSTMVSLMMSALRCDILMRLPTELADLCLSFLDAKSLCAASQVSKLWYRLIENNDTVWKNLLDKDHYYLTDSDVARAQREGWGYTGWTYDGVAQPIPLNAVGNPVTLYKAIYRRKLLIAQNWMSPDKNPQHFSIHCANQGVITCLEFDEDRIIAGSDVKHTNIYVYDTKTGKPLHHFSGHDGGVWALKYVNKDTLVSGSTDRTIRVWSISKARCTHVFRGHSSTVRCLDIIMPVRSVDPVTDEVTYTPPHPLIVSGSRDATLRLWKLPEPNEPEFHSRGVDDIDPYFIRAFHGHTHPVRAINGYEDTVVSGSYDTTVRVWKASTGECRWELTGHQQKVYSAVIDAKRNRCISASMDWSVKVWCIETGSLLYTLEGHTSLVGLLDLNRTTLVSAAADSTLRVWDPETGMLLHKLVGHQGPISCFQHDENKVVSGSDKTLKLWNIKTGALVGGLFEGLDLDSIWQVGFDSRRCVSAVARSDGSYLEVLDFDYNPDGPRAAPEPKITVLEEEPPVSTGPVPEHSAGMVDGMRNMLAFGGAPLGIHDGTPRGQSGLMSAPTDSLHRDSTPFGDGA